MRKLIFILLVACFIFSSLGCACLKESMRGLLAISTKEIENARSSAIVRIFDYDYQTCYSKVEASLSAIDSYIYAKRDDLIAVYVSQTDTTPAGVFLKKIDSNKTQLEIASPAEDAKEYLAEKIFSALENS